MCVFPKCHVVLRTAHKNIDFAAEKCTGGRRSRAASGKGRISSSTWTAALRFASPTCSAPVVHSPERRRLVYLKAKDVLKNTGIVAGLSALFSCAGFTRIPS